MFKRNVAYHEAGHAVAARVLGMPVVSVEVTARHGARHIGVGGRVRRPEHAVTSTRQELIFFYAGPITEARYRKRSLTEVMFAGFDDLNSDLHQIQTLLRQEVLEHDHDTVDKLVSEQASQLIETQWSEIAALAERLVSEGVVRFSA